MRTWFSALVTFLALAALAAAQEWQPVEGQIMSRWVEDVNPDAPWPEYPRPQMVRDNWTNLNGLWQYAVTRGEQPTEFVGRILVPFPIESALSGVKQQIDSRSYLWYRRTFAAPIRKSGERTLLHFGAVDWQVTVYLNGAETGQHKGGYDPFWFDVTDALLPYGEQELIVKVFDPTEEGYQPRGKQMIAPRVDGVFYTCVTGIWQTIWLEVVPEHFITEVFAVPNETLNGVSVTVHTSQPSEPRTLIVRDGRSEWTGSNPVRLTLREGDRQVAMAAGPAGVAIPVPLTDPKLWSPETPFLYNLEVELRSGDRVQSYCAIRKVSVDKDTYGVARLFLNGKPLFQLGPLDQGWWPDGLYLAPTDEALRYDIEAMKRMGFNVVRKHVKVEPARWYHWADKLGLLVWQDIPNATNTGGLEAAKNLRAETRAIIEGLRAFPSIVMWVIFSEGWGQEGYGLVESKDLVEWAAQFDPSRLIDGGSAWFDTGNGDVHDMHFYPGPGMYSLEDDRAIVLTEFGGRRVPVKGHTWLKRPDAIDPSETAGLKAHYRELIWELQLLWAQGLSAGAYTQLTDVENELNGYLTYDRKLNKFDEEWLRELHEPFYGEAPRVWNLAGGEVGWQYTTEGLTVPKFHWKTGRGIFGASARNVHVDTVWYEPEIWLRKTFEYNGEGSEVYLGAWTRLGARAGISINGRPFPEYAEFDTESFEFTPVKQFLRQGHNEVAVKVTRFDDGRFDGTRAAFDIRLFAIDREPIPRP